MTRLEPPAKTPPATPRTDFGAKVKAHQRYYSASGELLPGVTTILGVLAKPALVAWANRMGLQGIDTNKYVDETAAIGTLAHALIMESLGGSEVHLGDFTPDQLTRARHGLNTFQQWLKSHQLEAVLLEQPLVSDVHRYGGTPDVLAFLDGELVLIDIKTSSGIWPEYQYQLGAYWRLLQEAGQEIKGARILRIGKEEGEGMEERVYSGIEILNGWHVFAHCLEIYRLRKR